MMQMIWVIELIKKEKVKINKDIEVALDWLDSNPNSNAQEIKEKKKEVQDNINDVIERADSEKKFG